MTRRSEGNFFIAKIVGNNTGGEGGCEDILSEGLDHLSLSKSKEAEFKSGIQAYTRLDAVAAVAKALEEVRGLAATKRDATVLELTISPGQEFFFSSSSASTIEVSLNSSGKISQAALEAKKLRPYFNSFPLTSAKPHLIRHLDQLGYQLMNNEDSRPESFTIVHLLAGREQLFASVTLAVDEDLQPLTKENDPRLSEAKSSAVEKILSASTLGDVLPVAGSLKVAFRTLSLQVPVPVGQDDTTMRTNDVEPRSRSPFKCPA